MRYVFVLILFLHVEKIISSYRQEKSLAEKVIEIYGSGESSKYKFELLQIVLQPKEKNMTTFKKLAEDNKVFRNRCARQMRFLTKEEELAMISRLSCPKRF